VIRNFKALVRHAKENPALRVVVAGVSNDAVIQAIVQAEAEGFAVPVLVGAPGDIQDNIRRFPVPDSVVTFSTSDDGNEIAGKSVSLIKGNEADILLKGSINTSTLMKAVLDKETGIRQSTLLSDLFLFEDSSRDGNQLVGITDGGVVLYPDVDQKQILIENAIQVYHALGNPTPKVAVCAAIERVNKKMPPTIDAMELKQRYENGEITGCIVDGPLALDLALSKKALEMKGVQSPLHGVADILIMPNIEAANLVAKSTQCIAGKEAAHVIMGATAPVLIPSRSDTAEGKYLSIALASVIRATMANQ